MQNPSLVGRRYLVVEDNYLIASALADLLVAHGAAVCGPVFNLLDAAAALDGADDLDGGLLDIDVHGQTSYGRCDALEERGVPCLFVTAFTAEHIPAAYAHVPRLEKPVGGGCGPCCPPGIECWFCAGVASARSATAPHQGDFAVGLQASEEHLSFVFKANRMPRSLSAKGHTTATKHHW